MRGLFIVVGLVVALPATGWAKKKAAKAASGAAEAQAPSTRAISDLAGKFKWGQSPDEVLKVISGDLHTRYEEQIQKEIDTFKQDQLRKEEGEELEKVKASHVKFDGQKSGWDVSLIDKEFAHRNDESMIVLWEKDQRRFLFFWHDKLYKQYIAFNAEHPIFKGKTFDDFANLIQGRYGRAEMKFAPLKTKDDLTLDHLEWPPAGDFTLWAVDQSSFYGNFCLSLSQTSVLARLEKSRGEHSPKQAHGNAVIDAVTAPAQVQGDPNADVVDEVLGRKGQRTNQGGPVESPSDDTAKKKKGK
jgi:hypothetical protein